MTVRVSINGESRELAAGTTVADVVAELAPPSNHGTAPPKGTARGIAVAVNDEVVPRTAWPDTVLAEADRVEVLTAVQGG
ncbi:MAG TPA: sulfur carrier protein ThiS [Actinomycetes bacterium]|jgi:sulfur carrier protein|nr:sulfur carrier protein ThiS [Actinomycetes bacterium]